MLNSMSKECSQIIPQRLLGASGSGAWLTLMPNKEHGTALNAKKFRDIIQLYYGLWSINLSDCCDRCGSVFLMEHAVNGKNWGFVDLHHNEVADERATFSGIALTHTHMSHNPTIFSGVEAESMIHQSKQLLPSSDVNSSKKIKTKPTKPTKPMQEQRETNE